ncbi:M16 family metallopeptidase [Sphingomonas crusticola]|uniref:M16 family metallopeptidase n=1 Tax=Sphingomonas crusticola TaxID=1697973 RepID=UPI000E232B85|nr:insulinase family protein [Sphingomonas crusticola]
MKQAVTRFLSAVAMSALIVPAVAQAPTAPTAPSAAALPWLFVGSDIPVNTAWRFGTLASGLRYAVRQNKYPAGTLAIRVRIDAGALMEREDEKGYAHLIEHMTFRGTKSVPDGEGIRTWQRLGAQFGTDTNAFTTLSQTLYQLDLPKNDPASLDTALTLLSEMVTSANLDPKLVEIERQVVTAERALRQTPFAKRVQDVSKAVLLAGTRAAAADIAGTDATLNAASAERLRAFYNLWYRPERATVVIVGDADPATLEAAIRRHFGDWVGRGPAPTEPNYGKPETPKATSAVIADPQAPSQLMLNWVSQHDERPDTLADEASDLTRLVAVQVLSQRIARKARDGGSFLSGGAGYSEQRHVSDNMLVVTAPKAGQWRQALSETYGILADAVATLPSPDEIDQVAATIEAGLQAAAAGGATVQSAPLANQLVGAVDTGEVVAEPSFMLKLFDSQRKNLTPENVGAAMRTLIQSNARALLLSPRPVEGGNAAFAAALVEARATKAAARAEEKRVSLDDLGRPGAPGKILWTKVIPDLDVTRVKFDNGVELDLKRTGFEQAGVIVVAQAGDGLTALDPTKPSLLWTAPAIVQGGVGPLDFGGLERATAGKRIGLQFGASERSFSWSGGTTAAQLVEQLRLLDAAIREPRFDSNAFQRVRDGFVQNYDTIFNNPGSVFNAFASQPIHNGDPRFAMPTRAQVAAVTPDAYRAFWQPLFASGARKVLIIGDIDKSAAIEAARQTFGAAVTKPALRQPPSHLALKPPARLATPISFTHRGDPDQLLIANVWPTTGSLKDLPQMRALNVAAQIIQTRLYDRFRESEGGTYTPGVGSNQSETFPDYGVLIVNSQIKAERQADFERATREITQALAKDGPSADELARAIAPIASGNDRQRKLNMYWAQMLQGDLDDPRYVELIRTGVTGYQQVTAEAVRTAAQRWLARDPALRVIVKGAPPRAP